MKFNKIFGLLTLSSEDVRKLQAGFELNILNELIVRMEIPTRAEAAPRAREPDVIGALMQEPTNQINGAMHVTGGQQFPKRFREIESEAGEPRRFVEEPSSPVTLGHGEFRAGIKSPPPPDSVPVVVHHSLETGRDHHVKPATKDYLGTPKPAPQRLSDGKPVLSDTAQAIREKAKHVANGAPYAHAEAITKAPSLRSAALRPIEADMPASACTYPDCPCINAPPCPHVRPEAA